MDKEKKLRIVFYVTTVLLVILLFGVANCQRKKQLQQETNSQAERFGYETKIRIDSMLIAGLEVKNQKAKQDIDSLKKVSLYWENQSVLIRKKYAGKVESASKLSANASIKMFLQNTGYASDSVLQYKDSTKYIVGIEPIRVSNIHYLQRNEMVEQNIAAGKQINALKSETARQEERNRNLQEQVKVLNHTNGVQADQIVSQGQENDKLNKKLKWAQGSKKWFAGAGIALLVVAIIK